jgi:serine/threonine protein kinase
MSDIDRLDRLLPRWQDLCEQGCQPTSVEVCADCPELTEEFEMRLQAMEQMAAWLGIPSASNEPDLAITASLEPSTTVERLNRLEFLEPPDSPDSIGRFGQYSVLGTLGEGGMGIILKAKEPQLRRLVAIKVIRPDKVTPEFRQRFLREARALAKVEHERVVPVYHVDEVRGLPYLVMPLLQGESLATFLKRDRKLSLPEVLRIGREVAEGLAASHAAGLIHRDIKPSNIWLRAPDQRVLLLDFGLAHFADQQRGWI